MTKFREHRGTLDESMKTVVVIDDVDALFAYLVALGGYYAKLDFSALAQNPYGGLDTRIGWNTWMIHDSRVGGPVVGFSDGPIKGIREIPEPGVEAGNTGTVLLEDIKRSETDPLLWNELVNKPARAERHAYEDKLFLDFVDKQRREGNAALDASLAAKPAKPELPEPPGQTESPGIPLAPHHPFQVFDKTRTIATAEKLSTDRLLAGDQANKRGHPNRPIDFNAPYATDSIDAYQMWASDQPLPTPKVVEDSRYEAVKRYGRISNLTMGLAGEAGEAVELLKKHLRDDSPIDLPHLILELGDVALVISLIAAEFNVSMSEVLMKSIEKIRGRIERGTLRGAGDDR